LGGVRLQRALQAVLGKVGEEAQRTALHRRNVSGFSEPAQSKWSAHHTTYFYAVLPDSCPFGRCIAPCCALRLVCWDSVVAREAGISYRGRDLLGAEDSARAVVHAFHVHLRLHQRGSMFRMHPCAQPTGLNTHMLTERSPTWHREP
jgi:hypothetical protein